MLKKIWNAIVESRMAEVNRLLASYGDYKTYEELNRLSDRQLNDMGLERHNLARFVFIDGCKRKEAA